MSERHEEIAQRLERMAHEIRRTLGYNADRVTVELERAARDVRELRPVCEVAGTVDSATGRVTFIAAAELRRRAYSRAVQEVS